MKYFNIICIAFFSILTFSSCKEDESYDFPGDGQNKVYLRTASNTVNGYDKFDFNILQTRGGAIFEKLQIPVYSTKPANGDISVSLEPDETLVNSFNEANGTDYEAFPLEAIEILDENVRILSNSTKSEVPVEVSVKTDMLAGLETGKYLLPLKISEVFGDATSSSNRNKAYVVVILSKDEDNIWDSSVEDKGSLFDGNREQWTATAQNSKFEGDVSLLFDGDENERLRYSIEIGKPNPGFIVDMNDVITLNGVYQKFYWSSYAIPSGDVYTSIDNKDWTYQGEYNDGDDRCDIIFYTPVEARYIKILVKNSSCYFFYINEFNVYVKK